MYKGKGEWLNLGHRLCNVTHSVKNDFAMGWSDCGTWSYSRLLFLLLGNKDMNIIMWMDHRAAEQAERINATQHEVLKYVGGKISLEMQTPKLLWLKEVCIQFLAFLRSYIVF